MYQFLSLFTTLYTITILTILLGLLLAEYHYGTTRIRLHLARRFRNTYGKTGVLLFRTTTVLFTCALCVLLLPMLDALFTVHYFSSFVIEGNTVRLHYLGATHGPIEAYYRMLSFSVIGIVGFSLWSYIRR